MNVLHINQTDSAGGAGMAGYSLHTGLLDRGIDSRILAGDINFSDPRIEKIRRPHLLKFPFKILGRLSGLNYIMNPFGLRIFNHPWVRQADVINLHNLHSGYINYTVIKKIAEKAPTLLTLHDMWSFTGHCANSLDCDKWISGCGNCPYLGSYPKIWYDNTKLEWKIKKKLYDKCKLDVVVPSRWLYEIAKKSMLGHFPIHYIPHGIDTTVFRPDNKKKCREMLGLPNKYIGLFVAANLEDPLKGEAHLLEALEGMPERIKNNFLLITVGDRLKPVPDVSVETRYLGYVKDFSELASIYSAADLFIFPSLAESFGLVVAQSLACGTPVISYDIGGMRDLVRNKETGKMVEAGNIPEFRSAIEELLVDEDRREYMSVRCREIAIAEFSKKIQIDRYEALYNSVINNSSTR